MSLEKKKFGQPVKEQLKVMVGQCVNSLGIYSITYKSSMWSGE